MILRDIRRRLAFEGILLLGNIYSTCPCADKLEVLEDVVLWEISILKFNMIAVSFGNDPVGVAISFPNNCVIT